MGKALTWEKERLMCGPASPGMRALNWNGMCAQTAAMRCSKKGKTRSMREPLSRFPVKPRGRLRRSSGKGCQSTTTTRQEPFAHTGLGGKGMLKMSAFLWLWALLVSRISTTTSTGEGEVDARVGGCDLPGRVSGCKFLRFFHLVSSGWDRPTRSARRCSRYG